MFGAKSDVRENVHYVDESTVLYPAGHQIVLYHVESKTQRFIPCSADTEGITALALSPNRKYLAVAERAEKAQIAVYDLASLKRRKVLSSADVGGREYVSLSFSPDGRCVLAQGGAPEWNVALWQWEKNKCAAVFPARASASQTPAAVDQIAWNPSDPATASLSGEGSFRAFKMTESSAKALPSALGNKRDKARYVAHCWLPEDAASAESNAAPSERGADGTSGAELPEGAASEAREAPRRCVVVDKDGEVLVVENNEVRATLDSSLGADCVVAFGTRGFIVGGERGTVRVYDKTEDERMFKLKKTLAVDPARDDASLAPSAAAGAAPPVPGRVRSMALSPSEDQLAVSTSDGQVYVLDLRSVDLLDASEMRFEPLVTSFHRCGVTGVDVCVRKPLVATSSADKTVRVWNYVDARVEISKTFTEESHAIAFHPSGLHVLVGFEDKLRLCNVFMDDIRPFKEFPIKQCRECAFSRGGDMFAAVNGNVIQLYDAFTCANVGNLRGHGGKVRSVSWTEDDAAIVSAGADGAVYEWRVKDLARCKENVQKGCEYQCAVAGFEGHAFAAGSDGAIREFDEPFEVAREFQEEAKPEGGDESSSPSFLTQIALASDGKMLFGATARGAVRAYKLPLDGTFQEYQCHARRVTRLRLSRDDALLFCVSEDGCVSVFDVKDKDGQPKKPNRDAMPFAEEVLVTKADLEEKKARTRELENQVADLTEQCENELKVKDMKMNEKIKELTEKLKQDIDEERSKFDTLLQEKNEQDLQNEDTIKRMREEHATRLTEQEERDKGKLIAESLRCSELEREKERLNEKWDEQNSRLAESHERVIAELTAEFSEKLHEERTKSSRVESELERAGVESDETKKQMEEDADLEIEDLREKYELALAAERESGLRLKGENGIMKKKFSNLQKEIHEQKDEIAALFQDKKDLYATIASLEKDIAGLKKEIRERDETIGDKEKRIYDLKKKNQELEKFKFVLDYKIKELKKQIEPRERDVAQMKDTIQRMDHELERYHKNNANLDLTIADLRDKLMGLQKDVMKQRKTISDREGAIKSFQSDLHETSRLIQAPKALAASVKALYSKHVTSAVEGKSLDEDLQLEYARQREFLEKSIENLKRKLRKDSEAHKSDNTRLMNENVALIKEINELRREMKLARLKAARGVPGERGDAGVVLPALSRRGASPASSRPGSRSLQKQKPLVETRDVALSAEAAREMEAQRAELASLRAERDDALALVEALERREEARRRAGDPSGSGSGSGSGPGARLPPLEGAGVEDAAAAKIQAGFRGHKSRARTNAMRIEREEHAAAAKIQARHRGGKARRDVAAMRAREEAGGEEPPPIDKEDSLEAI